MGYALFAQRKLMLCGMINSIQMQQMQRSDEQMRLATNTLTLQSQITTLQSKQSSELESEYDKLMNSVTQEKYDKMQLKYGAKELDAICNGGCYDHPDICFVYDIILV